MEYVKFKNYTFMKKIKYLKINRTNVKKGVHFLIVICNVDTSSTYVLPLSMMLYYGVVWFDYTSGNIYINKNIFWMPESLFVNMISILMRGKNSVRCTLY